LTGHPELAALFVALRERDALTAYLDERGIGWQEKTRPEWPDVVGVAFEPDGEERWVATFWRTGKFKDLVWG